MPLDTIGLGRVVTEARRGDGQDGDALLVDEEGVFVGAVRRAAILDDAQPARGDLVDDPVVEQDDAVGDVFLEPVPRELPLAALGRDHGRDAALLEPAEQAAQLGAQDRGVVEAREQRLDRVEHDALRPDLLDGVVEPDEQALEIVIAGFLDLAALDAHVVDDELLVGDQARHVVAERGDVGGEIIGRLLEAHEDAGLAVERAPLTRNVMPNRVLPQPAAPQMSVGRPAGRPPSVISSRPSMPVAALSSCGSGLA